MYTSGLLFLVVWLSAFSTTALGVSSLRGHGGDNDAYHMTKMADRFLAFVLKEQASMENFGSAEQDRLESAIVAATHPKDKSLLESTVQVNEESRLENLNAFSETKNFVTTLKQIMGAVGSASACEDLTCGDHAHCAMKTNGAQCFCNEGFQGNGFVCRTPLQLTMSPLLLQKQEGQLHLKMADLQVTTLDGNVVVVVYRDTMNGNKGYVVLGHVGPDSMKWHTPVLFSNQSKAFGPVLVQLVDDDHGHRSGGIAIAFRNANRGGDGLLVGGQVSPTNGSVTLGTPKAFARHQAQAMKMIPLPDSRVAVIFAEHLFQGNASTMPLGGAMYGAALLAKVHSNGSSPEIMSKDRFAVGPVARFSVAALSPTSFGIAYRQGGGNPGSELAEAACIVGELHRSHIRFNSASVLLEPALAHIWARSLTLVGKNTISYTYHSADEKTTKQAILRADPKTHRLEVVHGPVVLAEGFSPVISSVAFVPEAPETQASLLLTVLGGDGPKPAQARLCKIAQGKSLGCMQLSWAARNLASISTTEVSDGRFVMLATDGQGSPSYGIAGLAL